MSHSGTSLPIDSGQGQLTDHETSTGIVGGNSNLEENFKTVRKLSGQQQQQLEPDESANTSGRQQQQQQQPPQQQSRQDAPATGSSTTATNGRQIANNLANGNCETKNNNNNNNSTRNDSNNANTNNSKKDTKLRDTLAIGQLIASNKPTAGSRLIASEIKSLSKCIQEGVATMKKELDELPAALIRSMKELINEDRERRNIFSAAMHGRRTARSVLNPLGPHRRFPVLRRAIRMRSRPSSSGTHTVVAAATNNSSAATSSNAQQQQQQQMATVHPAQPPISMGVARGSGQQASANQSVPMPMPMPGTSMRAARDGSTNTGSNDTDPDTDDDDDGSLSSGNTTTTTNQVDHPLTPISPPTSPV